MKSRIMIENHHENNHETTVSSQNNHDNARHDRFHDSNHELQKNHHIIISTDREDNCAK